jgi:transposase
VTARGGLDPGRIRDLHARIADTRQSFLHEVSTRLVQTHDRLCLEDLSVANLMTRSRTAKRTASHQRPWRGRRWPSP